MIIKTTYSNKIEVEKSKFFAILMPLNDVDSFKELYASIKKQHKKAKHVVYAYKVGGRTKSSDDQEPKGTAGRPLLELLLRKEADNVVLFVARYFGGVKLGAGRLLRTYVQAGIEVFKKAEESL